MSVRYSAQAIVALALTFVFIAFNTDLPAQDSNVENNAGWLSYRKLVECESWTQCNGTFIFHGTRSGLAGWEHGQVAQLHIREITDKTVIIDRTGPAPGFTAVYTGTLEGDVVQGDVTWTWPGHFPQPYHGHWLASANGGALQAALVAHNGVPLATIEGTWLANQALTECESATRCDGLWQFKSSVTGTAFWSDGSPVELRVTKITPTSVEIVRLPSYFSRVGGLYTGTLTNGIIEGDVTWTAPDEGNRQAHGHWFASTSPTALHEKLGIAITAAPAPPPVVPPAPLTVSKSGFGSDDRLLIATGIENPTALALDAAGNFLIADMGNSYAAQSHKIIRIQSTTGAISTVLSGGTRISDDLGDPLAGGPIGLVQDGAGTIYTHGSNGVDGIFRISTTHKVSEPAGFTILDLAHIVGRPSGPPDMVHLNLTKCAGIAGDGADNLYLAGKGLGVSRFNLRTRVLTPIVGGVMDLFQTKVTTPVDGKGVGGSDWNGDVIPATTLLFDGGWPSTYSGYSAIAYDPRGSLYLQAKFSGGDCVARVVLAQGTIGCLPGIRRPVQAIAVSAKGELFVSQDSKIYRYDEATDQLVKLATAPAEYGAGPIAVDKSGAVYLLCKGYIQRMPASSR